MITEIVPDGPAARAGLLTGDVLLEFAGHPLSVVDDLHRLLTGDRADTAVPLRLLRGTRMVEATVRPAAD